MDAWWPLLVRGAFEPALGKDAYDRFIGFKLLDNEPNNHGAHLGSAYQGGSYGLMQKDLRTLLGRKRLKRLKGPPGKKSRYSRTYCGGTQAPPRHAAALPPDAGVDADRGHSKTPAQLYGADDICKSQPGLGPSDPRRKAGDQFCFDSIWMRALGAAQQPVIHWINRPTFQQAVEIQGRAPR